MIIDILLLIFIITGFWRGYVRGTMLTLVIMVAYIAALLITLKISPWLAGFLSDTFPMGKMFALIFSTLGLLLMLIFLIHYMAKRVSQSVKKGNLSTANKIIGGLMMTGIAILFYSMLLWPINQFGMIGQRAKDTSMSYTTLLSIPERSKTILGKFKPLFSRYWQLMEETIRERKANQPQ